MNLLGLLENGLFALGQTLRFPVMLLLWVCVAGALFMLGRLVVEILVRRRERNGFDIARWVETGPLLGADSSRLASLPAGLRALMREVIAAQADASLGPSGLDHIVLRHEEVVRAEASAARILVRVGPSLGLIGTLIPMGTALAALATGNLEAMSGQMIVAFTTTIIGIACGTIAFIVLAVRQSWINTAVREQRFLAEQVAAELGLGD